MIAVRRVRRAMTETSTRPLALVTDASSGIGLELASPGQGA